ncbi:hypothetical protein JHK85_028305 [Glycine max]|nr:hypothetical protein JHK85_028305 [Glycine max]
MLPTLDASVCCQAADLLTVCGRLGLSGGKCCSQIDVKHLNADSENPITLVSGTVTTGGDSEQGVYVLVPLCQREPSRLCLSNEGHYIGMHPSTADLLTVLLLALPLHTWSGIKEEKLRVEALSLLATEDLPPLLQEERHVLVDGKVRTDKNYPAGFMDIETQRKQEANEFSFKLESTRRKLKEAIEEIDESKELEMKLAMTISYVDFLQNELKSVKEMDKRVQGDGSAKQLEGRFKKGEESEDSIVLQTITEELEAARKELALVREEGLQFMASLDVIRNELKHVTAETNRLKKKEGKVDSIVQNLNFKILRAKSKLEVVSAAEEKARSIVMSLSHTLEKLKTETEEAKKENEDVRQEVAATK